jgi:hypothetical protein
MTLTFSSLSVKSARISPSTLESNKASRYCARGFPRSTINWTASFTVKFRMSPEVGHHTMMAQFSQFVGSTGSWSAIDGPRLLGTIQGLAAPDLSPVKMRVRGLSGSVIMSVGLANVSVRFEVDDDRVLEHPCPADFSKVDMERCV